MLDNKDLEDSVRDLIIEICGAMYRRGYRSVSIGAMMRLVGVDTDSASRHDHDYIELGTEFAALIKHRVPETSAVPPDVTVH
jgi:hypothetical protein